MKNTVVIVDGMGGGIGVQLITKLLETNIKTHIIALGTNSCAAERMIKAGANRGASGENAIKTSVSLGDFILGPIGIVIPNSMMGEITPDIAQAVLNAKGERILIPLLNDHFHLAGITQLPLGKTIEKAIEIFVELKSKK